MSGLAAHPLNLPALVAAARAGDLDAYGQLVARFQDMTYAVALAHLGDAHLAHDATQEAFLDAFRGVGSLKDPAAFPGWLKVIVIRNAHRLHGARATHESVDGPAAAMLTSPAPAPADAVERSELAGHALAALATLGDDHRVAATLYYLSGRTTLEIAAFLDVPVSTVKKRLHDARRKLRERMADMLDEPALRDALRAQAPSRDDRLVARTTAILAMARAVRERDVATVRSLLDADPSLLTETYRHQDPRGETLLHVVVAGDGLPETPDYLALLDLVLARGADVNARGYPDNNEGSAAIGYCTWSNKPRSVERLLARGADPEIADERGQRAIDRAARSDRLEIFETLARAGAAYTLTHAVRAGATSRVLEAIDRDPAALNRPDATGTYPLHAAVDVPDVCRLLLARGADVSVRDATGRTPLHRAAENRGANDPHTICLRKPTFDLLLPRMRDPDVFIAARLGDVARLRALLDADRSLARTSFTDGTTALFYAARFGHPDAARLLIDRGADVNGWSTAWWMDSTPLAAAIRPGATSGGWTGHTDVVRLLLAAGADVNRPNHLGYTPLMLTARWHNPEITRLLFDAGAGVGGHDAGGTSTLAWAVWTNHEPLVRQLLDRGADVNDRGTDRPRSGRTPLHVAAEHGRAAIAALLLERGADATLTDQMGRTPLDVAEALNKPDVVAVLRR